MSIKQKACVFLAGCLLSSVALAAESDSLSVWNVDFKNTPSGSFVPPADWEITGVLDGGATVVAGMGGIKTLELFNRAGQSATLKIPFPGLSGLPRIWLEVEIGAGDGDGKGTVWFLKKGDFELRSSEREICLFFPDKKRVCIGRFSGGAVQTIRLLYDVRENRIVEAEVDGRPAEGFEGFPCKDLAGAGKLFAFVPTASNRSIRLARLSAVSGSTAQPMAAFRADEAKRLAALPRWLQPITMEPENMPLPPLPTWQPVLTAESLCFTIDPRRLENPAFSKDVLLAPEALVRLPSVIAADAAMADAWESMTGSAQRMLSTGYWSELPDDPQRYTYILAGRLPRLALVYAATGQKDLGKLVKLLVLDVVRRPAPFWIHSKLRAYREINPVGKIEAGELIRSVALSFLWANDLFSDEEQAEIRQALFQKGLDPCLRYLDGKRNLNNFLAVIGGGALVGSRVLGDDAGAALAVESLESWLQLIEDDGSYGEPEGYFEYGFSRFLMGWWALGREDGKARLQGRSLSKSLSYMASHFILHPAPGAGPSEPWKVNFGDDDYIAAPNHLICESLAYTYDQGLGIWMTEALVDPDRPLSLYEFLFRLGNTPGDVPPPLSPEEANAPVSRVFDCGVAVLRSGWTFDQDILFALRSGGAARTGYTHDAPNRNAFLLFVDGDYLLAAPGRASYRNPIHKSWDKKTLTYNTVTFNGEDQIAKREARITDFSDDGRVAYLASEAAPSYANQPASVLRQVWFLKEQGWFVVEDTVEAEKSSLIDWSLLLANYDGQSRISSVNETTWSLKRPSTELIFSVHADQPLTLKSSPGYMHCDYSYYPGDKGEGKLGSAEHMVWTTTEDVSNLRLWTLIIPRSQNLPGLAVDFERIGADNVAWTLISEKKKFLVTQSAGSGPEVQTLP